MASITVRGTASASVAPDRATLDLGLTHVGLTSSAALDEVSAQSQVLTGVLAGLGFTPTEWATQGVSLAEEWEWKNDTNTRIGYRASTGITVRIEALDRVGPLLRAAVDEANAQIRGLTWAVSDDHAARRALLGAAAHDAVQRAEAYAEALGLQRGAVEEVSELPVTMGGGPQPMALMARSKASDSGGAMSISGGEIELSASVDVRFSTLPR